MIYLGKRIILSPEEEEKIILRYKETQNYALVGREFHHSGTFIKKIIDKQRVKEAAEKIKPNEPLSASAIDMNNWYKLLEDFSKNVQNC